MKLCIFLLVILVSYSIAAPVDDSSQAQIIRYESENSGIDGYKFAFETSDGVSRQEEGVIKNPGTENETLSVRGTITWIAADGQTYTLNFIADENGFQPEGAHLPKIA